MDSRNSSQNGLDSQENSLFKSRNKDEDSSIDFTNYQADAENNRKIYMKVANAFLEQDSDQSENEILKTEEHQSEQKIQRKIIKKNEKEFETDYQLNKLNIDNNPGLDVIEMSVFDRIALFQARTIFEKIYKQLWLIKEKITYLAYCIVTHNLFTIASLGVITFNSIMLAQDDPTTNADNNPSIDLALLIIYTVEMGLKIVAYGFIFGKNSYCSDAWNIVDLVIIFTGYLPYVVASNSVNLSALRSLRVLRPLKSISKIKALNEILTALFSAIPLLKDAIIILCFFFAIFGIAGLQLFTGQLKTRCYDSLTGIYMGDEQNNLYICASDTDCPVAEGIYYVCAKGMVSPNFDFIQFDTFGWSVLNVYIIVSNEGWSTIMEYIQVGFSYYTLFYFLFTIYIGTWFLMNLTMAIIGVKYTESIVMKEFKQKKTIQDGYNMQNLIRWGIYKSNKILYKEIDEQKKVKRNLFDFSFQMSSFLISFKKQKNSIIDANQKEKEQNDPQKIKINQIVPLKNQNIQSNLITGQHIETIEALSNQIHLEKALQINLEQNAITDQIIENQNVQSNTNLQQNGKEKKIAEISQKRQEIFSVSTPKSNIWRQNSGSPKANQIFVHQSYKSQKSLKQRHVSPTKIIAQGLVESKQALHLQHTMTHQSQFQVDNKNEQNLDTSIREKEITQILDPSILIHKLEYIKNDQKLQKKRTKKLNQTKEQILDNEVRQIYQENKSRSFQNKDRKINFAPIQKQKAKYQEFKMNNEKAQGLKQLKTIDSQLDDIGQLSDRKRLQKSLAEMRRTSKRLVHAFQFQENTSNNYNEEECYKLDDEDFLEKIEQKEKQMQKKDPKNGILDQEIENNHLKTLHNDLYIYSLRNKKESKNSITPRSKIQEAIYMPQTSRSNLTSQSRQEIKQNNNKIINNRRGSLNQQKRQMFISNKGSRDTSNSIKMQDQEKIKSIQNINFDIGEESLSQISEMSFNNFPITPVIDKISNSNSKKTIYDNLFTEFDLKGEKDYGSSSNDKPRGIQERIFTKYQAQIDKKVFLIDLDNVQINSQLFQQQVDEGQNSDDESQEQNEGKKIEEQILSKINKQIDSKAEEFKLLLDSKYLKPRVIYEEPNDYTEDIQPSKKQKLQEQMQQEQVNKLKRMRFKIRQSSQIAAKKEKQRYLKQQFVMPYTKSKRVESIVEDSIFKEILEGKTNIEQNSQKISSKQGDLFKQDISSIGSPNPFRLTKSIKSLHKISLNKRQTITKEEEKNGQSSASFQQSGNQSPNILNKQSTLLKQPRLIENNSEKVSKGESEKKIGVLSDCVNKDDMFYNDNQNLKQETENNDNHNNSIHQDIGAIPSPSLICKSLHDGDLKDSINLGSKTEIKEDDKLDFKQQNSSKQDSFFQLNNDPNKQSIVQKTLSLRKKQTSTISKDDQSDTSYRQKYLSKTTEKKNSVTGNPSTKKGKFTKGDELEFDWNAQKAINKIFLEEQNLEFDKVLAETNNNNSNNAQGKTIQENLVSQLEQKFLKKSERQLDILNKSETAADMKSYKSLDTALTLSLTNINEEGEKEAVKKNLGEQDVEIFDLQKFAAQPVDAKFQQIRKKDIHNLEKKGINEIKIQTSADSVLAKSLKYKSQKSIDLVIKTLNYPQNIIEQNEGGLFGLFQAFRRRVRNVVMHSSFENGIMLCVVMNTIILCLDGLVTNTESLNTLSKFNFSFTIIFAIDMVFKIVGQGLAEYVSDKMNIFDSIIVTLSIFELVFLGGSGSSISAFRSIRILRVFRVLRMTRLLRSLQFMKLMITAISFTLERFIYILLLLFLFMFIYSLLGMSLFGGYFLPYNMNIPSRLNFDSFLNAFFAVLDLLTLENWNDLLTTCLLSYANNYICVVYLISWIFIGNYVFMNLVLAMIMESFDSVEVQNDKAEIENRFEIIPDLSLGHQSMGTTFMNNLSQSGIPSQLSVSKISGPQFGGGIQRMGTLSKQTQLNKSKVLSQNDTTGFEKQKSSNFNNDDEDEDSEENIDITGIQQGNKQDQKKKKKKKEFVYFEGVKCQKSIYLFSQEGNFRRFIYYIYKHPMFEKIILLVILLTSVKLTVDTYISTSNTEAQSISNQIDEAFTIFFLGECLIKIIALGFIQEEGSYLRDNWSQLDFFIVCSSIIDLSLTSIDLSAIKILRLLRTLRPLRLLSQNKSMKLIVTALMESMGGIANMIVVVLLIWLMFAILGMNLMRGKLNYCDFRNADKQNYDIYQYHETQCGQIEGAQWKTHSVNSDNIGSSMVMLFILSTFEGWPDYVWHYIDGADNGPVKNNSAYFAGFFFIFIFIGSFFSINLFTAIMSFNFDMAQKKSKNEYLTEEQTQWIELQRLIVKSTPDYTSIKPPEEQIRKFLWRIVESPKLDFLIITCIIGNIVVMAMAYDTSGSDFDTILSNINLGFTSVFIAESICKIIAYGVQGYFYKGWNQFDFFVVCTSIIDIVMTYSGKSVLSFLRVGPQIARVLRVLRVSRLLKLIKSFQGLQKLIQTTIYAFPKFLNATALFILFYFIFANLACYLFSDINNGVKIDNFYNFSTFHRSIIMLFICSTGENWYLVMYDGYNKIGIISIIFFIVFYTFQSYILMNLFVLIIINEFEVNYINPDNPLSNFNEQEENFKKRWVFMTHKDNGVKIHERFLTDFYFELPQQIGFDYQLKAKDFIEQLKLRDKDIKQEDLDSKLDRYKIRQKQEAEKRIMKMNIFCDYDGYIYFNELFYFFFKFSLYESVYETSSENKNSSSYQKHLAALDIIKKEEKVTMKKISIIKKKQSSLLRSKIVQQRQQGVNPMVRRLFVGMAFRSWLQYSIKTQDNINQINFNRDDISSQSDTDNSLDDYDDEDDNFFLNKSLEDGIQFKRSKNSIIQREHTVIFRNGGLKKYREENQNQQQSNQDKKYYRLPNTDVYRNEFYNESQNQFYDENAFDNQMESKNEIQNDSFLKNKQNPVRQSIQYGSPLKLRENIINSKIEEDKGSEASQSSISEESMEDAQANNNGGYLSVQRNSQPLVPKLLLERIQFKQ